LVDLAGSERAAKTGATAEQLKVIEFTSHPLAFFTVNLINAPPISSVHQPYPSMLFSGLLQLLLSSFCFSTPFDNPPFVALSVYFACFLCFTGSPIHQ